VVREKTMQLFNFYTDLGVRRRAASRPVKGGLKMLRSG
jgi:hypothetical protein